MKLMLLRFFATVCVLVLMNSIAFAQGQFNHIQPTVVEKGKTTTLEFDLQSQNMQEVQEAFLYYRFDGAISYQALQASIDRNIVRANINVTDENANTLEYYLSITLINESTVKFPSNGDQTPYSVTLVDGQNVNKDISGSTEAIDFSVLSPLPGEEILAEEALIAITLFYNEGDATADSLQLLVDGVDVTAEAEVTPYLITYLPKNLQPGSHRIELKYKNGKDSFGLTDWSFPVLDPNSRKARAKRSGAKLATGQFEVSARNQNIFGVNDDIYKTRFRVSGKANWFRYSVNGMITSQEDPRLQPQNRYGIELYAGNWFELQAGHIFPSMNPLVLAGNRVFGVNSALHLFDELINVQVTSGELRRGIDNLYSNVVADTNTVGEPIYSLAFEENGTGTFRRNILGGRVALGAGRYFQLGINALKVKDRQSSIDVIETYDDINTLNPSLLSGLSSVQRSELSNNPDLLFTEGSVSSPRDNLMLAGDLTLKGFKGAFSLRSDFGLSLLNEDISSGVLNQERADELGFDLDEDITDILDEISFLFIVNENMSYLPFEVSDDDELEIATNRFLFFDDMPVPTPLMASQNALNMNLFGHSLQARYQWVGPEYQTLSNTAMRRDISGYSFADRFRLLSNTLYLTAGYEQFDDNLTGNKESTTTTQIINGNISWYPVNRLFPRISVGYRMQTRNNGVERTNPLLASGILNSAVRNVAIVSGDTTIIATPRDEATNTISASISKELEFFGLRNDFTFNYMNLQTADNVYAFGDFTNNVYTAGVVSNWTQLPLRTNINFSINQSDGSSGLVKVDIIGLNVGGSYYLFNDKLNVFVDGAITTNSVETTSLVINTNGTPDEENLLDDYYEKSTDPEGVNLSEQNSFIFRTGATYTFDQHHSLLFDATFTNVSVRQSDITIPNDRVIQLRYVYRF